MSLYGTKVSVAKRGPRGVWPYFALALACMFIYLLCAHALSPWAYPSRDELVRSGGEIRRVTIRDDLSGTGAGAAMPTYVSVYITFRGIEGEFEYPWSHPKYSRVAHHLAVYADVLVEKAALDGPGPYKIWAIEENNRYKSEDDQTAVTYDLISSQLDEQQKTLSSMLKWMGGGCVVFLLWGRHTIRWNRRNYPPIE